MWLQRGRLLICSVLPCHLRRRGRVPVRQPEESQAAE
jgi:hypothetical protein